MSQDPSVTAPTEENEQKEEKSVTFTFGLVMIRTRRLLSILDKLAKYRIFAWMGWAFLGITVASGAFMLWLMLDQDYIVLTSSIPLRCAVGAATAAQCHAFGVVQNTGPPLQAYLLLPGLNPYIPILYGIVGIVVAVVIHEGTHGVLARSFKLPVKSTGVLLALIIPIGAFVEIDEKLIQKSRFRESGRIMAGGPGSNIIVALISLALLLLLVVSLVPAQFNGVYIGGVLSPSPAYNLYQNHQIQPGDLIVAVNGTTVHSVSELSSYMSHTKPNQTLILSVDHNNQLKNYTIMLGANKINSTITTGLIGVYQTESNSDLQNIKNNYANSFFSKPLLYLIVPGILSQADQVVPFSNALQGLYTSPTLGGYWYPVALTLFWIWFINVNLAFFNAIPLYPLDGGQALLNFFSHFGKKSVELRAKALTTVISLVMFAIILSFLFLPRILSLIPYG